MSLSTSPHASARRPLMLSLALICLFSLMLVGTSKQPSEEQEQAPEGQGQPAEEQEQPSEGRQGAAEEQAVTIPSSDDWERVELPEAGVAVRLPPGAEIDHTRTGFDDSYAGRYFNLRLASGREVYVSDRGGHDPVDIADKAAFYRDRARGFDGYIYRSDDALVARRSDAEPVGSYCETTACAEAGEQAMCVHSAGATIDAEDPADIHEEDVTKLSDRECLQVVAIVRSIGALK